MAKQKLRFSIDVLFGALYSRKGRPKELESVAENQIVKAIVVQLRSRKLEKDIVRATERRLWNVVISKDLNYLGKRRALTYLVRRKMRNKLKKNLRRKVEVFCKVNMKTDWVKNSLKHL